MLNIKPGQRAAVYCFYDRYGIADDYVITYLKGLKKVCKRIVVVVNGLLTKESETGIRTVTDEIIIRKNEGFDAWAYKTGLEYIGWDRLAEYEEVVICNSTVFGPVYPFREMFDRMSEKEDLDFWGITFHPDLESTDVPNPYGYIPTHIQFYFVVMRRRFIKAPELRTFWDALSPINTYDEAVGLAETYFTKYFADKGFKWDTYINYRFGVDETTHYILLYDPYKAVIKYRCPVIKRKLFFLEPLFTYSNSIGEKISLLLDYIKKNRLYNTDMIYQNIIRTADQANFIDNFNFRYSLPTDHPVPSARKAYLDSALVVMLRNQNGNEEYCSSLQKELNGIISTKVVSLTGDIEKNNKKIRNVLSKAVKEYKYIALWNDEEPKDYRYTVINHSNRNIQEMSMFASAKYMANVIGIFEKDSKIGMLMPGPSLSSAGSSAPFYDRAKEIAGMTSLTVPVSFNRNRPVDAGFAWLRSEALVKVMKIRTGSVELAPNDKKVLRVLLPYFVQHCGYAPGYISTDMLTARQLARNYYYTNK